ncbi:flagellar biosynthetic protein FliO [Alteromonadaceae bacterium BrNp21-10]|nr:flagellar biosynthetic protein FliO [Alteromonadaceae bacterium BrNp21-10]
MLLVKSKESKNFARKLAQPFMGGALLLSLPCYAQSSSAPDAASYVSILLSLIVVLAIIFSLGYLMRRFNVTQTGTSQMKLVSSMMVGTRERVMLIQVGEEQHLVGVTGQNINHLAKMATNLQVEKANETFKDKLQQIMQKPKDSADE